MPSDKPASVSLGNPNDGRLLHGRALPLRGPGFRFNERRDAAARFATDEVIAAIASAAAQVQRALPGSELVVNDLSLERGGPIPHHGSHRNGRDADILFYLLGDDGQPTPSVGAPLDPSGYGHDYKDLSVADDDVRVHLDVARTWRFVQALLADPEAAVQRIFVVEHVRSLLLDHARQRAAPAALVERFEHVTCQPGFAHDDHLHVRWFCHPDDIAQGCEDMHPIYPWQRSALAALGLKPLPARKRRHRPRSKVVSYREARRRAGPLHPSVRRFLARRKTWQRQPHPGRPYCP